MTFKNNSAGGYGGAIHARTDDHITSEISNIVFENNYAGEGGAIYLRSNSADCDLDKNRFKFNNLTFINNTAKNDYGGAIDVEVLYATSELINLTFVNNSAADNGGGVYFCYGEDIWEDVQNNMTIINVTFEGNSAGQYAGAIYISTREGLRNVAVNCTNVTFVNNNAEYGGAIGAAESVYLIMDCYNCTFTNNSATEYGGAFCGNGFTYSYVNARFINSTFANNSASSGGACYIKFGGG